MYLTTAGQTSTVSPTSPYCHVAYGILTQLRGLAAYNVQPRAGDAGFDDSTWPTIEAKSLTDRRGGGGIYMTWFRANLTMPARIGTFKIEFFR